MASALTARQRRAGVHVQVLDLADFQRDLERFLQDLDNLKRVYGEIADLVRDRARAAAPPKEARAIRRRVSREGGFVDVIRNPPRALGVFMGARRKFGWYAKPQYAPSTGRQFRPWVGNQWDPGDEQGKPYHIGDAINRSVPEVEELFLREVENFAAAAYPGGGGRLSSE